MWIIIRETDDIERYKNEISGSKSSFLSTKLSLLKSLSIDDAQQHKWKTGNWTDLIIYNALHEFLLHNLKAAK